MNCEICIAWHGLPFYAIRSIRAFVEMVPEVRVCVLGTETVGCIRGSDEDYGITWIQRNERLVFSALGMTAPKLFMKTSWSHPAFESLASDARESGGEVVILADNTFAFTPRKILGVLFARLFISRKHFGVFVPGCMGYRFMRMFGFPAHRIYTKLYCADDDIFRLGGKARESRLLFVGRFEPEKNVLGLIAGWKAYRERGGKLRELLMVGRGSIEVTDDAALGISVVDWAPQAKVRELMQTSAAFILPSKRDHWGVVLLEAALCGCALAATTSCGAAHDLVVDGKNGAVIMSASPNAIADVLFRLERMVGSAEEMQGVAEESRSLGERFSKENFATQAYRIWMDVVACSRARATEI